MSVIFVVLIDLFDGVKFYPLRKFLIFRAYLVSENSGFSLGYLLAYAALGFE